MTDEQTFEDEYSEEDEANIQKAMGYVRVMALRHSITDAFHDLNATQLRQWYVETFVLDPFNKRTLEAMGVHDMLFAACEAQSWPTIEHAAIGTRLTYALKPTLIAGNPDALNLESWRNPIEMAGTVLRLFEPWNTIRFDPQSENWYHKVTPGQWVRDGKGAPGQSMAEEWISRWLIEADHETGKAMHDWMPDGEALAMFDIDMITNLLLGSKKALRKYRGAPTTPVNIRKVLERKPIMWLDSSTLNRVRTMTPFSNGMLALVDAPYRDTEGGEHVIPMGSLLPMHPEYMVTNANSLKWDDREALIPQAIQELNRVPDVDLDWFEIDTLENELLVNQCPTYWSFLQHAFPDTEERSAFLRLLGSAMYGTNLKIVAAMIGEPNAGKDTVINWLSYLMPGQVANLPFSAFTPYGDEDRGFAPLMGARVATVSGEVGEGRGSKLLAEKIKTVSSGGGSLRVAEKYEKPTTIWYDGMLFLQGNSVPTIAGGDRALYENRLVAVEFKHPFALQARNYEGEYRTQAGAFAQVLYLNYVRYQTKGGGMQGINPPKSWKSFAKEFADAANPHGFIENAIVLSDEPIATSQFHAALTGLAEKFGSPYPVGANYWPKRLRALGFPLKGPGSVRKQVGASRVLAYYLTIDADKSDGAFDQSQWERVLADAAVVQ